MNTSLAVIDDYNPETEIHLSFKLSEATRQEKELKERVDTLHQGMEKVGTSYRSYFPNMLHILFELDEAIRETEAQLFDLNSDENESEEQPFSSELPEPDKKTKKQTGKAIRESYGKISKLCHPDKTSNRSESMRIRLKDLFIAARQAYKDKDIDTLLDIEATVTLLLSGRTEQQVKVDKKKRLEHLQSRINSLYFQLEDVKTSPIYFVYDFDRKGDKLNAKSIYAQVLEFNIQQKRRALHDLKGRIHSKQNDQYWSTI